MHNAKLRGLVNDVVRCRHREVLMLSATTTKWRLSVPAVLMQLARAVNEQALRGMCTRRRVHVMQAKCARAVSMLIENGGCAGQATCVSGRMTELRGKNSAAGKLDGMYDPFVGENASENPA